MQCFQLLLTYLRHHLYCEVLLSEVLLVTDNVADKLAEFEEVPAVAPCNLLFRLVV